MQLLPPRGVNINPCRDSTRLRAGGRVNKVAWRSRPSSRRRTPWPVPLSWHRSRRDCHGEASASCCQAAARQHFALGRRKHISRPATCRSQILRLSLHLKLRLMLSLSLRLSLRLRLRLRQKLRLRLSPSLRLRLSLSLSLSSSRRRSSRLASGRKNKQTSRDASAGQSRANLRTGHSPNLFSSGRRAVYGFGAEAHF